MLILTKYLDQKMKYESDYRNSLYSLKHFSKSQSFCLQIILSSSRASKQYIVSRIMNSSVIFLWTEILVIVGENAFQQ